MFQQYGASFFKQDVLRIGYASHLHFIFYGASGIAGYWSTITFDDNPVAPLPVSCDGRPGYKFKSSSFITDFISSAIRDIKGGKHSEALALFQFTAEQADRRKNKIIFRKCQFIPSKILWQFSQANSVIALKVLDIVKVAGGMFEPTPAPDLEGHYMTLLEMLNSNNRHNFASPNESLPSKPVGRCKVCPAWQFSSLNKGNQTACPYTLSEVQEKLFACQDYYYYYLFI